MYEGGGTDVGGYLRRLYYHELELDLRFAAGPGVVEVRRYSRLDVIQDAVCGVGYSDSAMCCRGDVVADRGVDVAAWRSSDDSDSVEFRGGSDGSGDGVGVGVVCRGRSSWCHTPERSCVGTAPSSAQAYTGPLLWSPSGVVL